MALPKNADRMANSVDPGQRSLIWVYTVCSDLSVRKFRNSSVLHPKNADVKTNGVDPDQIVASV